MSDESSAVPENASNGLDNERFDEALDGRLPSSRERESAARVGAGAPFSVLWWTDTGAETEPR